MTWFIAFSCLLIHSAPPTPSPRSYQDLSYAEKENLNDYFQRLYVLGDLDPTTGALLGVRGAQNRQFLKATKAYRLYLQKRTKENQDYFQNEIKKIFNLRQSILDWSFQFQKQILETTGLSEAYYKKSLKNFSPSVEPTYKNVIYRLEIELQQKEYIIRYPRFADNQVFPGWRDFDLSLYLQLVAGPEVRNLPSSIFQKISSQEVLDFDEYQEVMQALHRNPPLEIAYFQYLSLGSFDPASIASKEDLKMKFQSAKAKVQDLHFQLTDNQRNYFLNNIDFYWAILHEAQSENWHADWSIARTWSADKLSELNSVLWLDQNYSKRWPKLNEETSLKEIHQQMSAGLAPNLVKPLQLEIDDLVHQSGWYKKDEVFNYDATKEQITDGSWLEKKPGESAYLKLSPELRNLIVARLFPYLSISLGRTLLEGHVLDLKAEQFSELSNLTYVSADARQLFFHFIRTLNLKAEKDRLKLDERMVKDYFSQHVSIKQVPKNLKKIELMYGQQLPSVSYEKDQMRQMIAKYPEVADGGWIPKFLIKELMIHVFPYPDYLKDELTRFVSEWQRRKEIEQGLEEQNKIYNQLKNDPKSRDQIIEREKKRIAELCNNDDGSPKTDLGSPAVYLASFLYGAKTDPKSAVLQMGSGFVFYLVFRGTGGRIIIRLTLALLGGDAAFHVAKAYFSPDNSKQLIEFPLDKNFSTPIGNWAVKSLEQIWGVTHSLISPMDPIERLKASYDFGQISSSFLWFGLGIEAASASLPFERIKFLRRESKLEQMRIDTLEKIDQLERDIQSVQNELQQLDQKIQHYPESSSHFKKLLQEKRYLMQRLGQLEDGLEAHYRGHVGFFLQQGERSIFKIGNRILFLDPLPRKAGGLNRVSFKEGFSKIVNFWRRSARLGLPEYEESLRIIEDKLGKLNEREARNISGSEKKSFRLDRDHSLLRRANRSLRSATEQAMDRSVNSVDQYSELLNQLIQQTDRSAATDIAVPGSNALDEAIQSLTEGQRLYSQRIAAFIEMQTKLYSPSLGPSNQVLHAAEAIRNAEIPKLHLAKKGLPISKYIFNINDLKGIYDLEWKTQVERSLADEYLALKSQTNFLRELKLRLTRHLASEDALISTNTTELMQQLEKVSEHNSTQLDQLKQNFDQYFHDQAELNRRIQSQSSLVGRTTQRAFQMEEIVDAAEKSRPLLSRVHISVEDFSKWLGRQSTQEVSVSKLPDAIRPSSTWTFESINKIQIDSLEIYTFQRNSGNFDVYIGRRFSNNWRQIQKIEILR